MVRTKNQNQMLSTFLLVLSCVRNSFVLFAGFLFRWPLWISFILKRICEIHSALLHTLIMNRTNEIVIISHSTSKWVMVELPHDFFFWFFFRFLLQQIQSVYFQTMQCNLREIKSLIRTNNNKMHSPNLVVRQTAPLAQWIHIEPWVVSLSLLLLISAWDEIPLTISITCIYHLLI